MTVKSEQEMTEKRVADKVTGSGDSMHRSMDADLIKANTARVAVGGWTQETQKQTRLCVYTGGIWHHKRLQASRQRDKWIGINRHRHPTAV